MADDWIKMRMNLQSHPQVVRIMSATGSDKFRVIGGLHAVWSVFDTHSEDGYLNGYTTDMIDSIVGFSGIAAAMESVGWLDKTPEGVTMPRFTEHNGKSAKRRAEDAMRKRLVRNMSAECPQNNRTKSGPEKRREEKEKSINTIPPLPPAGETASPPASSQIENTNNLPDPEPKPPSALEQFVIDWNEAADRAGWPPIRKMTDARKNQFRLRSKDEFWISHYREALAKADRIRGMCGDNPKGWRMDVDFFLRPDSVVKIVEGKYDNWGEEKKPKEPPAPSYPSLRSQILKPSIDETEAA